MTNSNQDFVSRMIARRSEVVTCEHCERKGTRYYANSTVQAFYSDGERYYGFPLKANMGSIIVQGLSCSGCVRTQAQGKVNVLSATYVPAEMATRPLQVNEMP